MFNEIEIRNPDIDILVPILSNMGFLMNNVNDKSFLDLLDKNIEYVTSLLQMTLLINSCVQKDCIEVYIVDLLSQPDSYFEKKYDLSERRILDELSNIIFNLNNFMNFPKKESCILNFFKGLNWKYNNQIIKPVEEIYKSYVAIYNIYYSSNTNINQKLNDRLNNNMRILFNLIDDEENIKKQNGYM